MRAFFAAADLIQIDSTPLILWGRLLGLPLSRAMRSTYLDWRGDFWKLADARAWRVFYLGGAPGVAETLPRGSPSATRAHRSAPTTATSTMPATRQRTARCWTRSPRFDPDVLMVGMGMPLQEIWAVENRSALARGVILTVGAAFDYEAGAQTTPPRWTGRLGVEWLARLIDQPRRLGYRYLIEPWWLLGPALGDVGAALARRALPGRGATLAKHSAR